MALFKKKKKKKVVTQEPSTTYDCSNFSTFCDLVKDQFEYGGKKYALNEERESTDVLFEVYGKNWLYGTMAKYCFRYKNLARERDLLKIACYAFILWLKKGYFLQSRGLDFDNVDTNVKIKSEFFPAFVGKIGKRIEEQKTARYLFCKAVEARIEHWGGKCCKDCADINTPLNQVSCILQKIAGLGWAFLTEELLFLIFCLCFRQWIKDEYHKGKTHDTDTYNK